MAKLIIDEETIWMLQAAKWSFIIVIVSVVIALFFQFIAPITLVMEIFYLIAALMSVGCIGALIESIRLLPGSN